MPSVIVAAPPFSGELQPLLELAGGLVERGHEVTVLTGSRFEGRVAAPLVGGPRDRAPEPHVVREAVLDLLTNTEVRAAVDRLAADYARHDTMGTIEQLLFGP